MQTFTYLLNGRAVSSEVEGEIIYGGPEILADIDDDLTKSTDFARAGYTVVPFLDAALRQDLRAGIESLIAGVVREAGVDEGRPFTLEDYHSLGGSDPAIHAVVVRHIARGFPLETLPIDYRLVERRIGEVIGVRVTARNEAYGLDVFNMRIVRPRSNDNNPLHRDVWLDRLRNAVNIYVPIAGSNELSSLSLVPGSHRWAEANIARTAVGARVNGSTYTVPAVVGGKQPIDVIRPNPAADEVLIFSPYLIHGGAVNFDEQHTRVSVEMRFWRAA
ncbi:MAG TPA: hypothetical protein VF219_16060 [Vicinamibacterales bacterium]